MTVAFGTAKAPAWRHFALPLAGKLEGLVFSLKTFAAAILALAISYWLEVKDPQWAVFTTYLLAQPLVGAVWAKGAFRLVGTVGGAVFAVLCVGLFAQAGPLFILAMALWLAFCTYGATLARNYASYGFALAGFSAPLIGFGSVATPDQVWSMAVDRTTEVALGIVCVGLVHVLVLPRYAGDALRASLAATFSSLAHFAAIVLRPGTSEKVFTDIRGQMSGEVIKFDSLRFYAVFEAPELRGHDEALSRMMRAFLGLLSVARGLYVRLDDLRRHEDPTMAARLDPALDKVAELFEAIAADRDGPSSPAVNAALTAARDVTGQAQAQLEAKVESEPLESLANSLLVLQRTGDMITSLSRVVVGVTGAPAEPSGPRFVAAIEQDRGAALAQAARAASALILIGVFWIASAWTAGAMAMTGLAIMMVFFVTTEKPGRVALSYVLVVALAMAVAFFCMAFLMPRLGDFEMLAALLAVVLIPTGIIMLIPKYAFVAAAFAAFFLSQLGLSNMPSFDTATYIDNSIGLLLGLAVGVLAIDLILPYNPETTRRREWADVVAALPAAARGERPEIGARLPIQLALLKLMPRLDLTVPSDDEILGGSFGAASMSLELVRLRNRIAEPAFPADARGAVTACLDTLAQAFEQLVQAKGPADRARIMDEAASAVAAARKSLAIEPPMTTGTVSADTIALAHALASLRFIADRLDIDRPFLTRTLS